MTTIDKMSALVMKMGKYGYRYNVFLHSDFGEYARGVKPNLKRVLWVSFGRLSCLLCAIRFGLFAYFDNPLMRTIMTDITYTMGNHCLTCLLASIASIILLSIGTAIQYLEMNHKMHVFNILYIFSLGRFPTHLNYSRQKRLAFVAHALT